MAASENAQNPQADPPQVDPYPNPNFDATLHISEHD